MMVFFNTVDLAVAFQKRNGKTDPPDCDEEKSNSHGRFHRKSQCLIEESQRKAGEKWNTCFDIAQAYPRDDTSSIRSSVVTSVSIES